MVEVACNQQAGMTASSLPQLCDEVEVNVTQLGKLGDDDQVMLRHQRKDLAQGFVEQEAAVVRVNLDMLLADVTRELACGKATSSRAPSWRGLSMTKSTAQVLPHPGGPRPTRMRPCSSETQSFLRSTEVLQRGSVVGLVSRVDTLQVLVVVVIQGFLAHIGLITEVALDHGVLRAHEVYRVGDMFVIARRQLHIGADPAWARPIPSPKPDGGSAAERAAGCRQGGSRPDT